MQDDLSSGYSNGLDCLPAKLHIHSIANYYSDLIDNYLCIGGHMLPLMLLNP